MKVVSFRTDARNCYGVVTGDGIADAASLEKDAGATLREVLERGTLGMVAAWARTAPADLPLDAVEFLPVIPDPRKILCVGINYKSHVAETGRETPNYPVIFTRFADSQTGHLQPIIRPRLSQKLDFEGELAVVIGKAGRHIKAERALEHVAGYSAYNDGSIRDWQRHSIQFIPGKNFPQTGGFGPWLVTTDEIPDPSQLSMTTRLNGKVMQECRTDDMIFSTEALVAYCSDFTPLNPGDVIITGTTGGVGAFREPPVWMKPGDVVEVEISGIGTLRNTIADE